MVSPYLLRPRRSLAQAIIDRNSHKGARKMRPDDVDRMMDRLADAANGPTEAWRAGYRAGHQAMARELLPVLQQIRDALANPRGAAAAALAVALAKAEAG
jgi:hypothetical protein